MLLGCNDDIASCIPPHSNGRPRLVARREAAPPAVWQPERMELLEQMKLQLEELEPQQPKMSWQSRRPRSGRRPCSAPKRKRSYRKLFPDHLRCERIVLSRQCLCTEPAA